MSCFLLEERHDVSLPFHSCFCPTLAGRFGGGLLWCAGRLGWHAGPVQNPWGRGQWIFITRDHLHETIVRNHNVNISTHHVDHRNDYLTIKMIYPQLITRNQRNMNLSAGGFGSGAAAGAFSGTSAGFT